MSDKSVVEIEEFESVVLISAKFVAYFIANIPKSYNSAILLQEIVFIPFITILILPT